jgi:hypothetical protein
MSSQPLEPSRKIEILNFDAEQRCKYLLKQVVANQEIWILTDQHGSVMVTTDEEDCIPVWPNQEFAQMWATNEWEGFEAKSISLTQWHKKWTSGLEEDELSVVVFPLPDDEGAVLYPTELDDEIKQMANKVK